MKIERVVPDPGEWGRLLVYYDSAAGKDSADRQLSEAEALAFVREALEAYAKFRHR